MGDRRNQEDRRAINDRRRNDRRRGADHRRPMFEICRSMLYLALVHESPGDAPQRVVTRAIRWRKESESLHTEQGLQELTEAFRVLVAEEKLVGSSIRVVLNGELCVSRVISGPADYVRNELSEQQERSRLYLSLGPGQKVQATSIRQIDARHQHALLSVTSQLTLDAIIQVAETVGVQVEAIEPSLVALARAQGRQRNRCEAACLIVQVDERGVELGICHEGHLLLDYRPAGRAAAANVHHIVEQQLGRLERFLSRHHGYESAQIVDMYLCGEPGPVELARRRFAEQSDLNIHVLDPSAIEANWQHSAKQPGSEFAAVLGAALLAADDHQSHPGPNLLEHILAAAREPMRPILLRSAAPLAAALLISLGLGIFNFYEGRIVRNMRAEMNELAPVVSRTKELRLTLTATDGKLAQLQNLQDQLSKIAWAKVITRVAASMPDDVWLDRFSVSDSASGNLEGASYTDGGVFDFVNHLEQIPDLKRVALEGTGAKQSPEGPTTSFDLQFALAGTQRSNDRND